MKKEEFVSKLKEVDETLVSLCHDDGVFANTSLYGFLWSALMSLDFAVSHSDCYVSDEVVEVTLSSGVILSHDEERD